MKWRVYSSRWCDTCARSRGSEHYHQNCDPAESLAGARKIRDALLDLGVDEVRIVRILTHEESKRKYAATVLRKHAAEFDCVSEYCATAARFEADKLWPLKPKDAGEAL